MTTSPTNTSSQSRLQSCDGADSSKAAVLQRVRARKALLIGINYGSSELDGELQRESDGTMPELTGPHKDVENMRRLLIDRYHYPEESIVVLLDDGRAKKPTRAHIIEEMEALVKDVKPGDHLLFHYAGHGGQKKVEEVDKTEDDGYNEAIIPCDASQEDDSGWILDNDLNRILVKSLGTVDCRLVAIFDMCHAGTALDLKHYECNRVYVPFITKSRRWTNLLRYRAQRRRDGTFIRASGEFNDQNSLVNGQPAIVNQMRTRTSTLPQCCDAVHRSSISCSFSEHTEANPQTSADSVIRQDTILRKRNTYPSFAQVEDAMGAVPELNGSVLKPNNSAPHAKRKFLRISTRRQSSSSTPLTIPEVAENEETKSISSLPSPTPACGCLPPIAWPDTVFTLPRSLAFLRLTRGKAQDDKPPITEHEPPRASSLSHSPPRSQITGEISDDQHRSRLSDSTPNRQQTHRGSSVCSDGYIVESPVSNSPIQTRMPEVKYDPCHVGHGLEEDKFGPFVISLSACADGQAAFEDARGQSMTAVLIEILKSNPNPTYRQLMTEMSHRLYESANLLHAFFRKRAAKQKGAATSTQKKNKNKKVKRQTFMNQVQEDVLGREPVQEPILGSERKLDLNSDLFML